MNLHLQNHSLNARARSIFDGMLYDSQVLVDRLFSKIFVVQWLFGIGCAWLISPLSWSGSASSVHLHVWSAILLGGVIVAIPLVLIAVAPGQLITRLAVSAGQFMYSALLVHLMGGRIEAHFHVFVSLALLSAYRDRSVFIPAVLVTTLDHLIRGYLWPQSVFGVSDVITWRPLEHGAWVVFETITLCYLVGKNLSQAKTLASLQCSLEDRREELEQKVEERTKDIQDAKTFQESILNAIDAEICVVDDTGNIVFVNDRWKEFGDQHGGKIKGLEKGYNYLDACDRSQVPSSRYSKQIAQSIRDVRDKKLTAFVNEYTCRNADGKKWFHVRITPVQFNGVPGVALIHIDVTETKQVLSRAESLAKIVLNSPEEVYIVDKATLRFVEINQGSCKNLGYDRDTLLTMTPMDLHPNVSKEELLDSISDLLIGKVDFLSFESTHYRKDGSFYQCNINLHNSIFEDEEVIVAFATDITERKELEQRLSQAQKLESLGQLAAGIAHEINTPMQCVFGNVEFLNTSFEKLMALSDHVVTMLEKSELDWSEERQVIDELRERYKFDYLREQAPLAIQEASNASSKVISIVRAMKIMSHPGTSEKLPTDIHDMIRSAAMITKSRWKNVAELECEFAANLHAVDVYPAEMSQVFINLIVNAGDAIYEKSGESPSELGKIKIQTVIENDWLKIIISDSGVGFPKSLCKRIFDPFFTTKGPGKGTGQGLAITHNVIVNHHSGTIDVESEPGVGTTFVIRIPRFPTFGTDKLKSDTANPPAVFGKMIPNSEIQKSLT